MIVGTVEIDTKKLLVSSQSVEKFRAYSESLVPQEFKHVKSIKQNQLYICCLRLRKEQSVTWARKNEILEEILPTIKICGYATVLIEAGSLLSLVNIERVKELHKCEMEVEW